MVRRDSPITDAQPPPPSEGGHWHAFRPPDGTPTIAGQLLIYDLDESPPPPEVFVEKMEGLFRGSKQSIPEENEISEVQKIELQCRNSRNRYSLLCIP